MQISTLDNRGRITLGRKLAKKYGKKFIIVPAVDEIILMKASSKDPIKELIEMGRKSKINKYSMRQLKKIIEEEFEKEAMSNINL